jgi:hypothetical protein
MLGTLVYYEPVHCEITFSSWKWFWVIPFWSHVKKMSKVQLGAAQAQSGKRLDADHQHHWNCVANVLTNRNEGK